MSCFFDDTFKDIDVEELRKSAENVLEFTQNRAKSLLSVVEDKFNNLENNKKNMIILGVSVFAGVLIIAGVFYLLGKHAARKEFDECDFEEWDG
ncbi:hypothetical protein [Butyrivibrio sp. AE3004]|uniref:hypothetical protein n=1 Tax=Butyrivibrio sp. AE3004 TaxID=1506994 RepID=UPI000493CEE5|nr:hypothetical protein [Butyrivibrio sp. AE3004]